MAASSVEGAGSLMMSNGHVDVGRVPVVYPDGSAALAEAAPDHDASHPYDKAASIEQAHAENDVDAPPRPTAEAAGSNEAQTDTAPEGAVDPIIAEIEERLAEAEAAQATIDAKRAAHAAARSTTPEGTKAEQVEIDDPDGEIARAMAAIEDHKARADRARAERAAASLTNPAQPAPSSTKEADLATPVVLAGAALAGASSNPDSDAHENTVQSPAPTAGPEATAADSPDSPESEPAADKKESETGKAAAVVATATALGSRVAARINESEHNPRNGGRRVRRALAAVAFAATCLVGALLVNGSDSERTPSSPVPSASADAPRHTAPNILLPTPGQTQPNTGSPEQTAPTTPTPPETIPIYLSEGALSMEIGEGWYHEFNELGIAAEHHATFLNQVGEELMRGGWAYQYTDPHNPNAQPEYRMRLRQTEQLPDGSVRGKLPRQLLEWLNQQAAAQGFLAK